MKKTILFINLTLAAILTLLVLFFFWKLHSNSLLKQGLEAKRRELKEAHSHIRQLEKLERERQGLIQKEESLNKMAPAGEKQPLGLIKTLIAIGSEIGIKNATFNIEEEEGKKQTGVSTGQTSGAEAPNLQEDLSENVPYQTGQAPMLPTTQTSANLQPQPMPLGIEINFEATYLQALDFLKGIAGIERIVVVEGIVMERKKEILPYQRVSLKLVTYTFLNQ